MSKRMPQKAGWIFVVVFVGLHLLYCALDLKRCLMVVGPYDNPETALYQLVEQASAFLRFFLAGSSFVPVHTGTIWPRDIAGACLIGSFVVAATIWLLAYYGWKKTYQFWGAALVLSILLGAGVDILAGQLSSDLAIVNRNFAEVPLRCAVYVLIYQIPSWLLYRGSQQLARNLMQNRDS